MAELPLGDAAAGASGSHVVEEGSSWGEPLEWRGRVARPMLNYGSPFHKVAGAFVVPHDLLSGESGLTLRLDYWSDDLLDLVALA